MSSQNNLIIAPKTKDILSYESEVWTSADVLRSSVGLKNSEFPDFMMPFFALRMVESRLIRKYVEVSQDSSLSTEQDRIDEIKETVGFYNSVIIEEKLTLAEIVKNDKNFYSDLIRYLNAFDEELKQLLGAVEGDKTENLNLVGVIESLRKKNVLFGYATAWAKVEFTPYDNSEITTLEEHIKRKWADMSAETAGEQYTPDDIINLISELIVTDSFKTDKIYKLYDMTCGGGNMLFGVEDKIQKLNSAIKTSTYGQELRGSLYALAKIESMFRQESKIEHGNTLTNDKLSGYYFDYGVANPPYGVSWKEEQKTIENDQTGRFGKGGYPSSSDAQLLFVQHMLSKLNETGKAFIVLNGSPLFSGDAGGGESGIRKWILDNDYLEALIQLPTNEFFNTGITTYIWCLNKEKSAERKDKVLCINAEDQFIKLKKNKGNKSKEISVPQSQDLAKIYKDFTETTFSKVLSKYDFYYNKQSLKKLEVDENGIAFQNGNGYLLLEKVHSIVFIEKETNNVVYALNINLDDKTKEFATKQNEILKDYNNGDYKIQITLNKNESYEVYSLDENNCIIKQHDDLIENLGYGNISVKCIYKKQTNKNEESINIEAKLEAIWTKDEEKIKYFSEEFVNKKEIVSFIHTWVSDKSDQYELLENKVGVEINFNNVFPKKIEIRSTEDILKEITMLDTQLGDI